MKHIIPISGKDSLVTALVQSANHPELDYTYIFNDVGSELPETYEWLDRVESITGWSIQRIGSDLEATIKKKNVLPSRLMRYCTADTKIKPFEKTFQDEPATVYYGLRADEPARKGYVPHKNIIPKYPLRELKINLLMVLEITKTKGLKPPTFFWETLYNLVNEEMYQRLPLIDWHSYISEIEFDYLFAGRSRSNCYFCFFQRLYEWVWLDETHPDLFEKALELEQTYGAETYNWRPDYSLLEVRNRANTIINKRVKKVCKHIESRVGRRLSGKVEPDNELAFTSCGLLCGK